MSSNYPCRRGRIACGSGRYDNCKRLDARHEQLKYTLEKRKNWRKENLSKQLALTAWLHDYASSNDEAEPERIFMQLMDRILLNIEGICISPILLAPLLSKNLVDCK